MSSVREGVLGESRPAAYDLFTCADWHRMTSQGVSESSVSGDMRPREADKSHQLSRI